MSGIHQILPPAVTFSEATVVDGRDASTWVPPGYECVPVSQILPPALGSCVHCRNTRINVVGAPCFECPVEGPGEAADDKLELLRWDLAETARLYGLGCTARVIASASTPAEWSDIAADFNREDRPGMSRYDVRAASDACERLAAGDVDGAIVPLAEVIDPDLSIEGWLVRTRSDRPVARPR